MIPTKTYIVIKQIVIELIRCAADTHLIKNIE
nr:MAG TPA: hypothetical protein [Caudoviricetes sp.]